MKRDIHKIRSTTFDLVIIGGGITGACLAHDAALKEDVSLSVDAPF